MIDKNLKDYITKIRQNYKKISSVSCSALNGEKILFNKYGFDHLIWKGKKIRNINEQVKRLHLSQKVPNILKKAKQFKDYRVVKKISNKTGTISTAQFWSISEKEDDKTIIVVIRQTNNGSKHFFSVMYENNR